MTERDEQVDAGALGVCWCSEVQTMLQPQDPIDVCPLKALPNKLQLFVPFSRLRFSSLPVVEARHTGL